MPRLFVENVLETPIFGSGRNPALLLQGKGVFRRASQAGHFAPRPAIDKSAPIATHTEVLVERGVGDAASAFFAEVVPVGAAPVRFLRQRLQVLFVCAQ